MLFDPRPTSYRAHRTTILINDPDWKWIKKRGLKPTNLLRRKIQELKKADEEGDVDFKKVAENFRRRFEQIKEKLQSVLSEKQFDQFSHFNFYLGP